MGAAASCGGQLNCKNGNAKKGASHVAPIKQKEATEKDMQIGVHFQYGVFKKAHNQEELLGYQESLIKKIDSWNSIIKKEQSIPNNESNHSPLASRPGSASGPPNGPKKKLISIVKDPTKLSEQEIVIDKGQENKLSVFYSSNSQEFLKKLREGPPAQFRWHVWKTVLKGEQIIEGNNGNHSSKTYEEYVTIGRLDQHMVKEIGKDINRSYAHQPYFRDSLYGATGQAALHNVLIAYSAFNAKVGYC